MRNLLLILVALVLMLVMYWLIGVLAPVVDKLLYGG